MGCHCSTHFLDTETEEESLMAECECALGFVQHSAEKMCTAIRVLTVNQKLNWNRLKKLGQEANIPVGSMAKEDPVFGLYSKIGTENDGWDSRRLALLAILLGKGSDVTKAELLFTLYDHEYNKYLTAADIDLLAHELCDIALVLLPSFSSEYLERSGSLDAAVLVQNYGAKLAEAQLDAVNEVKSQILDPFEEQVSLPTFKEKVAQGLQYIFSAKRLRNKTVARYKQLLRDQARHKSKVAKAVRTN